MTAKIPDPKGLNPADMPWARELTRTVRELAGNDGQTRSNLKQLAQTQAVAADVAGDQTTQIKEIQEITGTSPDVLLGVPTAPELSTTAGNIMVKWDGAYLPDPDPDTAQTPADPSQIGYMVAEASTAADGTYQAVGTTFRKVGTQFVGTVTGASPGDSVYVRLRPYKANGEAGEVGPYSSVTLSGVGSGDLDSSVNAFLDEIDDKATQAQTSANSKNTVWYQTAAPAGTDHAIGDTWFDTDDGNRIYVWDGAKWEDAQDKDIFEALQIAQIANANTEQYILNPGFLNPQPNGSENAKWRVRTGGGHFAPAPGGAYYVGVDPITNTYEVDSVILDATLFRDGAFFYLLPGGTVEIAAGQSFASGGVLASLELHGNAAPSTSSVPLASQTLGDYGQEVRFSYTNTDSTQKALCVRLRTATTNGVNQAVAITGVTARDITPIQNALDAANGKNKNYYQDEEPIGTDHAIGDTWFDTDDGNRIYVWDGAKWEDAQDGDIADAAAIATAAQSAAAAAQTAANAAQTSANGKNKVTRSTAVASGAGVAGDIWYQYSGANVIGFWIHNGTSWVSQALANQVIATLDAAKINTGYLSADRIQGASITAAKMVAGTITAASGIIADAAIGSAKIIDGAITTAKIGDAQITNAKIANLDAAKITTGILSADRIGANSLTIGKVSGLQTTLDGKETPAGAQSKANAAETAATNAALIADAVKPGTGTPVKTFHYPLVWGMSANGQAGSLVIKTPITFSSYMSSFKIRGYNYRPGGNSEIDLSVGAYIYSVGPTFTNSYQASYGSMPITVTLARHPSDNTVVFILDNPDGLWYYTKIEVVEATLGHTTPPDSFKDGWTAAVQADVSSYLTKSVPPRRDLNETYDLTQAWRSTGTTTINGGQITTDTIVAGALKAWTIAAGQAIIADSTITNAKIANLDAAKITTGFLDVAQRIAAGAITTDKLLVGDFQNYFNDPTFGDPRGYSPWTVVNGGIEKNGTGTQNGGYNSHTDFAVTPGDQFVVSATRTNVTGSGGDARVYLQRLNDAGAVQGTFVAVSMTDAGNAEGDTLTIPTGTTKLRVGFYTESSVASGTRVRISDVRITRLMQGKLLVNGTVNATKLIANSITATQIAANTITATEIATDAITADELAANSIYAGHINSNAVTASKISSSAVTTDKLDANAVTAVKIAANAVTADKIVANAITSKHTITGALIRTAASGARTEMNSSGIRVLNSSGVEQVRLGYGIATGMSIRNPHTNSLTALSDAAFGMEGVSSNVHIAFDVGYNGYPSSPNWSAWRRHSGADDDCILTFTAVASQYVINFSKTFTCSYSSGSNASVLIILGLEVNGTMTTSAGFDVVAPMESLNAYNSDSHTRYIAPQSSAVIATTPGSTYRILMRWKNAGSGAGSGTVSCAVRNRYITATPIFR